MVSITRGGYDILKSQLFLISWISLVIYVFYDSFIFYKNGPQFYYLRQILGLGLCISRGTATVLNVCCALVLLPLCKKLNQVLYQILSKLCPRLFFFWLERMKGFHMTIAKTLLLFAVIHSVSHLANLWNFSRGFDEVTSEINFAAYKNENPLVLLVSQAGLTGVSMLAITSGMAITSLRVVRRRAYNAFWYTHQLYLLFMLLLLIHPLSGVLKQEIIEENQTSQVENWTNRSSIKRPQFVAIKSKTWLWMALPLGCFFLDLLWRVLSRNRARVDILEVSHMAGRTVSLRLNCPHEQFRCRMGQYVLLQCADISLLEWHPFTVVKIPSPIERDFVVWIRVKGDWTESMEKLLLERGPKLSVLVDGPFSSAMEGASRSAVAVCVAAGVGITPFVAMLQQMLRKPRARRPGRVHLLWIVRHEREVTWLADLANNCIQTLRNANRPDRLHLELYVTGSTDDRAATHTVVVNDIGVTCVLNDDEKESLLTPQNYNSENGKTKNNDDYNYKISKDYPLLGCRIRRGRPHWDRVFGYWMYLYPGDQLDVYCCGPKKLVKMLRSKCNSSSRTTKTKFTFVHEGFS